MPKRRKKEKATDTALHGLGTSVSPHVVNLRAKEPARPKRANKRAKIDKPKKPKKPKRIARADSGPKLNLARAARAKAPRPKKPKPKKEARPPRPRRALVARRAIAGSVAAFAAISLLIMAPIQGLSYYKDAQRAKVALEDSAKEAFVLLGRAVQEGAGGNHAQARRLFGQAGLGLAHTHSSLKSQENLITFALEKFGVQEGRALGLARDALEAGMHIAAAGQSVSGGLETGEPPDAERLAARVDSAFGALGRVIGALDGVPRESLPQQIGQFIGLVDAIGENLDKLAAIARLGTRVLADPAEKRYLVYFQNSNEIRPTGGFLGSMAIVTLKGGRVEDIFVPPGGTYDLQGQISEMLISPEPLHYVNARWECQDSNWYFDFPTSARRMASCYESARSESVDGVVVVNDAMLSGLLEVTGPVDMPSYDLVLDSGNAIESIQEVTEVRYEELGVGPKQIIGDLRARLEQEISAFSPQKKASLASLLVEGLARRDIQLWFADSRLQREVSSLGWAGQIQYSEGDYLAVVHTNIGGGKSDLKVSEEIFHSTQVGADGTMTNELTITREHSGREGEGFSGLANQDFVRVYVPFGSVFLDAKGWDQPDPLRREAPDPGLSFDEELASIEGHKWTDPTSGMSINDEFQKTVFSGWVILEPGERQTATVRYRLPQKLDFGSQDVGLSQAVLGSGEPSVAKYTLYRQRQSGAKNQSFAKEIDYDSSLETAVHYPQEDQDEPGIISFGPASPLTDEFFFAIFTQ